MIFKKILLPIHFLFPEKCSYCQNKVLLNDLPLCDECISNIEYLNDSGRCDICKTKLEKGKCLFCESRDIFFNKASFVFNYSREAKSLLKKAKFEKRKNSISYLEKKIIDFVKNNIQKKYDYIFLLPSSNIFLKKISKVISKELKIKIICPFILKNSKKQKTKGVQDRHKEIEDKIYLSKKFQKQSSQYIDKKNLLIDDVYTTGATLNYASKLLITQNIKKSNIDCLAFFRRDRKQI